MKFTRMILSALVMLMVVTGCARRNSESPQSSSAIPEVASSIEHGADELKSQVEEGAEEARSRVEEGVSRIEDNLTGDESMHDGASNPPDGEVEPSVPAADREAEADISKEVNESVAAAMSTDFSQIGALSNVCEDGFPGGPVDDLNRPSGPVSYQEKYKQYGAHFIVPDSQKIYLTFDEGYENGYTAKILDVLKEKEVKAVFFITYPYAKSEPSLVKRMVDEGHTVGNHSTAHKVFPEMPLSEAAADLMQLHDYVKGQFGYEMFLFRPPEGKFSEQTLALAQSLGYQTMLWSFAYKDYDVNNQPLTVEATDKIVRTAHPGEIALLHAVSQTNAEILGDVIDQLRASGYEFADYFSLS